MQQKFKKAIDENQDVDVDKICDEVLGTRSGYIKGLGYGPKPNASRCGHAKIIKDLEEEKNMWKKKYEVEVLENKTNRAQLTKHEKMLRQILGAKYDEHEENSKSGDKQGDHQV
ncbi:uncharacterized protein LOC120275053 [Dioscorea cayenensis subsp. rotundata]|uniref:Uncharacterized protein LOC120275053 n=1 Tax=Dioscorea cayennensis subsp. rotundata TaxID=55577 RepID=A0AB40CCB0_DIOCR|nr:uncharacterized protein LOC120275053 [Dioscorea cayenensis subsp. rotundata]